MTDSRQAATAARRECGAIARPRAWTRDAAGAGRGPAAVSDKESEPVPFALVAPGRRGPVLWAVNREAGAKGLRPGMRLADARALLAGLVTARADAAADRRGLERLALWCNRFTPWCAVDSSNDDGGDSSGDGGLLLDISGCAHLFGGEVALMDEIAARLAGLGIETRLGLADTPGAAWALARFGTQDHRIAAPGGTHGAISGLPVEALRLAAEDAHLLRRLGLVTIGAVDGLPRASLPAASPAGSGAARCSRASTGRWAGRPSRSCPWPRRPPAWSAWPCRSL